MRLRFKRIVGALFCIMLLIRPDYLWKTGTVFSAVNAARDGGAWQQEGLAGLEAMFADQVPDKVTQVRAGKPSNVPICIQAQVLVPYGIPMDAIQCAIVREPFEASQVLSLGWPGEIETDPRMFEYRADWIEKR
jgi:hypothetical protein